MPACRLNTSCVYLFFLAISSAIAVQQMTSGTFFKLVTDEEEDSNESHASISGLFTPEFHKCSLNDACNFIGMDANDKSFYKVAKKEDLKNVGKKLKIWEKLRKDKKPLPVFKSCKEAMEKGQRQNGTINMSVNGSLIPVYCDMVTDHGGWIVFQKRTNSQVSFERNWKAYEDGFGDLNGNFWLGLKALHSITSTGSYTLRIDLQRSDGLRGYAKYANFVIGSKEEKYKLEYKANSYTGNAGDGMWKSKGMNFSTYDQDNDQSKSRHCASLYKGGWWFKHCFDAILNNLFPFTAPTNITDQPNAEFMSWLTGKFGYDFGRIVFSEMKMKEEN